MDPHQEFSLIDGRPFVFRTQRAYLHGRGLVELDWRVVDTGHWTDLATRQPWIRTVDRIVDLSIGSLGFQRDLRCGIQEAT